MKLKTYLSKQRGRSIRLAKAIGSDPTTIHQYAASNPANARPIPPERCPDIEQHTNGEVNCEDTRRDVKWVRVEDETWPHPKGRPLADFATKRKGK